MVANLPSVITSVTSVDKQTFASLIISYKIFPNSRCEQNLRYILTLGGLCESGS